MKRCEHCGAERHEDSDQPVDEAWLRSVGFVGDDQWRVASGPTEESGPHLCFAFVPVEGDEETPRAWIQHYHPVKYGRECANIPIPMPVTRGDVRRLLAALATPETPCLSTDGEAMRRELDALRLVHQEARELVGEADATGQIPQANLEALRALLWRATLKARTPEAP